MNYFQGHKDRILCMQRRDNILASGSSDGKKKKKKKCDVHTGAYIWSEFSLSLSFLRATQAL